MIREPSTSTVISTPVTHVAGATFAASLSYASYSTLSKVPSSVLIVEPIMLPDPSTLFSTDEICNHSPETDEFKNLPGTTGVDNSAKSAADKSATSNSLPSTIITLPNSTSSDVTVWSTLCEST